MDMDTIDTILQLLITDKAYYLKKRQDCLEYLEVFCTPFLKEILNFRLPTSKHDRPTTSKYASKSIYPEGKKNQGERYGSGGEMNSELSEGLKIIN